MTFDKENLKPMYQMVIREAGESCAFYIARRLGMPGQMLKRAAEAAYGRHDENGGGAGVKWRNAVNLTSSEENVPGITDEVEGEIELWSVATEDLNK